MKAIIVAGGRGERLRPITDKIPKPMVEVRGKTILEHTIDLLKNNGISDLIMALCYLPEVIVDYFGNGKKFGVNIKYTFEDPNYPLGSAGAIRESEKFIDNDFIVTYADILRKLDVKEMIKYHQKNNLTATINVYKRYGSDPKSMITINANNSVVNFIERPAPDEIKDDFVFANASFYIFKKKIFNFIRKDAPVDFGKDVFPLMIKNHEPINAFESDDYFIDIGNLEKLEKARETFLP
jgi:mannose-1-phosphate guanylyltransferase/phosphomannomutase